MIFLTRPTFPVLAHQRPCHIVGKSSFASWYFVFFHKVVTTSFPNVDSCVKIVWNCETSGRLTFVFIISSWVHWPWQAWPLPNCPGIKKHEMKCHSHWRPCGPCFKFITWLSMWLNFFLYLLDLYEKEKDKEGLKRRWCLCGNSGLVKYIHVARPTIHRLPLSVQGNATGNCRNVLCGA